MKRSATVAVAACAVMVTSMVVAVAIPPPLDCTPVAPSLDVEQVYDRGTWEYDRGWWTSDSRRVGYATYEDSIIYRGPVQAGQCPAYEGG